MSKHACEVIWEKSESLHLTKACLFKILTNITSGERLSSVGPKRFMSVKPFKSLIREKLRDEGLILGPWTSPLPMFTILYY